MTPLSEEELFVADMLFNRGFTAASIARLLDRSPSAVARHLKSGGRNSLRRPSLCERDLGIARALYLLGLNVSQVAELLGVSVRVVSRGLKALGVEIARGGRAQSTAPEATRKTKWCPSCESVRPASSFWASGRNVDGLQSECSSCGSGRRSQKAGRRSS